MRFSGEKFFIIIVFVVAGYFGAKLLGMWADYTYTISKEYGYWLFAAPIAIPILALFSLEEVPDKSEAGHE